jgi:hypothetical protein
MKHTPNRGRTGSAASDSNRNRVLGKDEFEVGEGADMRACCGNGIGSSPWWQPDRRGRKRTNTPAGLQVRRWAVQAGPLRPRGGEGHQAENERERDGEILFPFLFCKLNFPNSFKCSFETFEFQNKNQTVQ